MRTIFYTAMGVYRLKTLESVKIEMAAVLRHANDFLYCNGRLQTKDLGICQN
jgi:hypothetical protein